LDKKFHQIFHHPLFSSLYFPSFLTFFAAGLLGAVTPIFMASFDVDYSTIGLMLSMSTIGKMVLELPAGILIPRIGVKKSMLFGTTTLRKITTSSNPR